jgi:hypothetical protein
VQLHGRDLLLRGVALIIAGVQQEDGVARAGEACCQGPSAGAGADDYVVVFCCDVRASVGVRMVGCDDGAGDDG